MLKTIKKIPVWIAIIIMVACVPVGIALGNNNALNRAVSSVTPTFAELSDLAYQRVDIAEHRMLVLCRRNIPDDPATKSLEQAIEVSRRADTPHAIAQADLALASATESVLEPLNAVASAQDKKLATGVMDDFKSTGKILSRGADAYNNGLQAVEEVYNALPMQWLLGGTRVEAFK